ncbi:MAG TPA: DUF5985 family protein [Verrucomicrobiae bacterium]|nr:DUF5985 family protein [Verrucomicrobiae bacterium]
MRPLISHFLSGGIFVGFLAIAFFFFRFWRKTRDTLFSVFAASFFVLAIERILLLATAAGINPDAPVHELRPYVYWVRFFAFMLIIAAFCLKNRRSS